jgi:3-hydroxy-9,10-secoandrosta-1,3,5(10)-triene-9,17-dione monooxygenase
MTMNAAQLLGTVRDLKPVIAKRAADCERLRRLPDETFRDFQEAGLFRWFQPRTFGGDEGDPLSFYQAQMEIGEVCGSSAWVLGVLGVHVWQMGLFSEKARRDVWGDDRGAQISSALAPQGKVVRAPGGYRLSGQWSFSSGCDHAPWVVLGGIVREEGIPPTNAAFLVPREDYQIIDTWFVCGLAGTGSKDILVEDAFVPEHRVCHRFYDVQPSNPRPLYRLPFGCVFRSGIATPAIGAARGALRTFVEQTRSRLAGYDKARIADDPFPQAAIGEGAADVHGSRERFEAAWREIWARVESGQQPPMELRRRIALNCVQSVESALRLVTRLFALSGGRAIYLDNPIQRVWRDVNAMRHHALNNADKVTRMYGRYDLDPNAAPLDPGDSLI